MNGNFLQNTSYEKITIDKSNNVKITKHFEFVPLRGSILTPHQACVRKTYSISKIYGWFAHQQNLEIVEK